MYIYPENLKGKSTMFLWTLRDMLIIIIGAVLSAVFAAALDWIVPGVLIGVFAFLTLRIDNELNISDYIRFAFRFFVTTQQIFIGGLPMTRMRIGKKKSTREEIGARNIDALGVETYGNEYLVYFLVQPDNIAVLSETAVKTKIMAMSSVIKGLDSIEFSCMQPLYLLLTGSKEQ